MTFLCPLTSASWRTGYVECMNPIIEWMLMIHRVVWFPLNWTLGLDRTSVELPIEFAPALHRGSALEQQIVKDGRPTRASGAR
jgi:hypothetical protein